MGPKFVLWLLTACLCVSQQVKCHPWTQNLEEDVAAASAAVDQLIEDTSQFDLAVRQFDLVVQSDVAAILENVERSLADLGVDDATLLSLHSTIQQAGLDVSRDCDIMVTIFAALQVDLAQTSSDLTSDLPNLSTDLSRLNGFFWNVFLNFYQGEVNVGLAVTAVEEGVRGALEGQEGPQVQEVSALMAAALQTLKVAEVEVRSAKVNFDTSKIEVQDTLAKVILQMFSPGIATFLRDALGW